MIIILIKLIAAHLIGDFIFQTDKICEMKYSNEPVSYTQLTLPPKLEV